MRILLRAGKRPEDVLRPEATLQRGSNGVFGSNVGNLLFSDAVYRTLNTPGTEIIPDSFSTERSGVDDKHIARINSEFEHFVVPLANAFRPEFLPELNRLTFVIEQLTIPVTVVGVGAQLSRSQGETVTNLPSELKEPVRRFMHAVLQRSTKVGVRGEFTREYLESLGFGSSHVDVIGCPSLLEMPEYRVDKQTERLSANSKIAFNAVPSQELMGAVFCEHLERFPQTVYVPQEYRELALLMWGQAIRGPIASAFPDSISHPEYGRDRTRFFVEPGAWRDFLASCDFSFGSRIHGNIAALAAGTPAVLISHDSRTRELAEYHQIPFRVVPASSASIRAEELYDWADFTDFHAIQRENFDRFRNFLDQNELSHTHPPEHGAEAYTERAKSFDLGGPVRSLAVEGPATLASRLNWLWQGRDADHARYFGSYVPPFVPAADVANRLSPSVVLEQTMDNLATAERTISGLKRTITDLEGATGALRDEVSEIRRWSTRPFAAITEGSLIRRVARRVRRMMRGGRQ